MRQTDMRTDFPTRRAAPLSGLLAALAAPFRGAWHGLALIAVAGPAVEALNRLTRTSDAELRARGTSRQAELRRIMGVTHAL